MYDPVFDEVFGMSTKDTKWWNAGNPLWVEVQRHGLKSGVYFWPGSEAEILGLRPNIWKAYDQSVPFKPRVDTVVDWLMNTTHGVDFAMLYFHEPDYTGHRFGPDSQEVRNKVSYMDEILGYIVQKFDIEGLWSNTHLIVTSDHGMAAVDMRNRSIDLSKLIDISAIKRIPDDGPITHIEAVQGKEEELYRNLSVIPHMRVYKKQDIPDRWHYKHNRRILPLLGVAEEGWMIIKVTVYQLSRAVGKRVFEHARNAQAQMTLLNCKVSSGSLVFIHTFLILIFSDSEGPDQTVQADLSLRWTHTPEGTLSNGAAQLTVVNVSIYNLTDKKRTDFQF